MERLFAKQTMETKQVNYRLQEMFIPTINNRWRNFRDRERDSNRKDCIFIFYTGVRRIRIVDYLMKDYVAINFLIFKELQYVVTKAT